MSFENLGICESLEAGKILDISLLPQYKKGS